MDTLKYKYMDYELLEQLKNTGFPFRESGRIWCMTKDHQEYELPYAYAAPDIQLPEGAIYLPRLEELIEACGVGFRSLENSIDDDYEEGLYIEHWYCNQAYKLYQQTDGKTPLEAVAKLFIALNKNK